MLVRGRRAPTSERWEWLESHITNRGAVLWHRMASRGPPCLSLSSVAGAAAAAAAAAAACCDCQHSPDSVYSYVGLLYTILSVYACIDYYTRSNYE